MRVALIRHSALPHWGTLEQSSELVSCGAATKDF
jgi:hypothetical protein